MATFVRMTLKLGSEITGPSGANRYLRAVQDEDGSIQAVQNLLSEIQAGITRAKMVIAVESKSDDDKLYSGTVAISHASISDGDTLTIGGVVLTWKTTPTTEDHILIGANATADGDNLVTTLAAHTKLKGAITGVNAAGTVTLAGPQPCRLATSDGAAMTLTQQTAQATNHTVDGPVRGVQHSQT